MSSSEIAIAVNGVSKRYDIYAQPTDRLKRMVLGRLRNVLGLPHKSYAREFWALEPITFSIQQGETVGIIGRNGSGKSTLLQIICGTMTPSSGSIQTQMRIAALLELGAGFNAEFTGAENVRLSALIYGISEEQLAERYGSIVAFSELQQFIDQPVKTYSSGMYVRLAFSVAAHVNADILVVDEALSVGDIRFQQKCARFLRDFKKRGTLLFVSHDTGAVVNLCARAIWLEAGRVVADGASKDVVEAYLAEQHAQDRASIGQRVAVQGGVALAAQTPFSAPEGAAATSLVSKPTATARLMETFCLDPSREYSQFGAREVEIETAHLIDALSGDAKQVSGGETVTLCIRARARGTISDAIFGFYVKDRLGQRLFGENSYMTRCDDPVRAEDGDLVEARFTFRMPLMPAGEYTIDVAVATGSQSDHTQQHWIYDALSFHSFDTTMRHGLVGIPMSKVEVTRTRPAEANEVHR